MTAAPPRPHPRAGSTAPPRCPRRRGRTLHPRDPGRRLNVGLLVMLTVLVLIGGRLVQLQGLDGTAYAAAAEQQRLVQVVLPAQRGQILDRSGQPLAYSVEARAIYADPAMVESPARTALALAPLLGTTADDLEAKLSGGGRFVYLARGLDPADAQKIIDLNLAGIGQQPEQKRIYPAGSTGAQVVGFTDTDDVGLAGIERQFNDLLTGKPGQRTYEQGRLGAPIPAGASSEQPAVPGSDVRLTLDEDLQFTLEQAIATAMQGEGVSNVQAVVLDSHTGQVLAMGSAPGYNSADPGASNPDLLVNATVSHVLEPGSANKVVTFSAALERGVITPDTVMSVPDHIAVSDIVIHDAWGHDPINFTATGILAKSSNVGTVEIAQKLGDATLEEYLHRFGLGSPTGIELPAESGGILAPREDWSGSQAATIPIGQGISMTVLQLASMYQAIANDGVQVPPRIVAETVDPDGTAHPEPPAKSHRAIDTDTAQQLQLMLEAVTHEGGTAPLAAINGYRVAGKTGTAQRPNPECSCYDGGGYWATFAGFAPADNPRYVIAISVEQPGGEGHGGAIAAPVFTSIMSYALQENGIAPTGSRPPEFQLIADGG